MDKRSDSATLALHACKKCGTCIPWICASGSPITDASHLSGHFALRAKAIRYHRNHFRAVLGKKKELASVDYANIWV
jgi:hypothetical protein